MIERSGNVGRILRAMALCGFAVALAASPCRAERLSLTAGLGAQTMYNDNVHLKDEEDFEHKLEPSLELDYGQEDWNLFAGAVYSIYRYDTLDELDHEDLSLRAGGSMQPSERLGLGLETSYNKDYTFQSVLEESGDIGVYVLRETMSAAPTVNWTLSEKDQLTFSVPVTFVEFQGDQRPDAEFYGANVYWSHLLDNERTRLLFSADWTERYYDTTTGDINQDVYTVMGGMGYQLTELLTLEIMAGGGYTDSITTRTGLPDYKNDDTFFSFDIAATYAWDRWTFTLSGDRQQSPNTSGDSNLRTRIRFNGNYKFSERFQGTLDFAVYENVTKGIDSKTEKLTYSVQPRLKYQLTEDLDLQLSYKFLEIENQTTHKVDQQNRCFLGLEYHYNDVF